jgi:hypothetical protein
MEAAGVELSRRVENRELIEELENRDTQNTHDWAFSLHAYCTHERRDSRREPAFRKSSTTNHSPALRNQEHVVHALTPVRLPLDPEIDVTLHMMKRLG